MQSPGTWRRMILDRIDVWEKSVAYTFKVERIHELGTMLAETNKLDRTAKKH
jgi:hypothetical protein